MIRRILLGLLVLVAVMIVAAGAYLFVAPPELLRVADAYAAKMVCSNAFLAHRDPQQVLALDVQAPGNPVLKLVRLGVDDRTGTVTARMLGLFASGIALYRPGLGCVNVPDGDIAKAAAIQLGAPAPVTPADAPWPTGNTVGTPDPRLTAVLGNPKLTGPELRAVVVVKDGNVAGEVYGPGFDKDTPLIGWSMSKSVNAVLVGMAIGDGKLSLDQTGLFPGWTDARKDITLRSMLSMTSGLHFNEDYGDVTDVTRMLYLEPDMTAFAAEQPSVAPPGKVFSYSTGVGVMLAKLWMDAEGGGPAALAFPRQRLFGPLGMTSAVFEADEAGTLVGGSYVYASGRDWARLAQLLLQEGQWNGARLIAPELVAMMRTSNGLPGGYSQFQTWVKGPHESEDGQDYGLPGDTFWLEGHDGQSVAIVPSQKLIVVRMGLTPWDLDYRPEYLLKAVSDALANGG